MANSAFGTQWGFWTNTSSQSTDTNLTGSTTYNSDGSITSTYITATTTTTTNTSSRTGNKLTANTYNTSLNLGTFVTDINILPYIPPARVKFIAHGLKPNTRVYAFFGNVPVSNACYQTTIDNNGNFTSSKKYGEPLITDNSGSITGIFYIQPETFQSQEITFMLTDIYDLTQGENAITTKATAVYYGSRLSFTEAQSILNTREAVININEISENNSITTTNTVYTSRTVVIPPPPGPGGDNGTGGGTDGSSGGDGGGNGGDYASADTCDCAGGADTGDAGGDGGGDGGGGGGDGDDG